MSRAFVKETEGDTDGLPDRPISPHRNLVTEAGLAAIDAAVERFEMEHRTAADKGDQGASAEVVKPLDDTSTASFGMTVSLRRDDGREQSFRIVGEDEADPSRGTVSYVSPLARAVLTHGRGETVVIGAAEAFILGVR
jgi:transcription elongation GreA/GreB family factor